MSVIEKMILSLLNPIVLILLSYWNYSKDKNIHKNDLLLSQKISGIENKFDWNCTIFQTAASWKYLPASWRFCKNLLASKTLLMTQKFGDSGGGGPLMCGWQYHMLSTSRDLRTIFSSWYSAILAPWPRRPFKQLDDIIWVYFACYTPFEPVSL